MEQVMLYIPKPREDALGLQLSSGSVVFDPPIPPTPTIFETEASPRALGMVSSCFILSGFPRGLKSKLQ